MSSLALPTVLRCLGIPKDLAEGYAKQHQGYGSMCKTLAEIRQHVLILWYPGVFNESAKKI